MTNLGRILATIESPDHLPYVIDKAVELRDRSRAELMFTRTHYDRALDDGRLGFSAEERRRLADLETEAERIKFRHFIGANAMDQAWKSTVEWSRQPWQGVIEVAHNHRCDLIVKDTHVRRAVDGTVVRTPHDWGLLHHADVPVMMLKPGTWAPRRAVVAALDVFDSDKRLLNRHVVEHAAAISRLLDARLHLVNALPVSPALGAEYQIADYRGWVTALRRQRRTQLERLAQQCNAAVEDLHVEVGLPWSVVTDLVARLDAEFLVLGKVRPAVHHYLDTTSERLLHAVASDVVSVP